MRCSGCQKYNNKGAKFCAYCGEDLEEDSRVKKKIRVTPAQELYVYTKLKLEDFNERKQHFSKRLNTPPQGPMGKLLGNSGEKVTRLHLKYIDEMVGILSKQFAILEGVD